jgi:hypothetical protein
MSHRLQVLIPEALDGRIQKAAARSRQSKGAWVRRAIERALAAGPEVPDALDRLSRLGGPTGNMDQILNEIEAGRG